VKPKIVVVGLGPAGPELLTVATRAAIDSTPMRFLRTERHPSAGSLSDAVAFDEIYESAVTVDDVYVAIVERLVAEAAQHGQVLYAVPGSPRVAERSVDLLVADERIETEVLPAMSFLDLAWVRVGIDPLSSGVLVVDGHNFLQHSAGSEGPFLIAQCDSAAVLSEIKISVDPPDGFEVQVLQRLGLPDEAIETVRWEDLDRSVDADHLTSVFVPQLTTPVAPEFARFQDLVLTLRNECPWDREQTHDSLRRHLLEETYEVLEAIDGVSADASPEAYEHLEEELGDLLYQIYFHAALAAEEGYFGVADVATGIHNKLRSRHPHVFGDVSVADADDALSNWEAIKRAEKQRDSALDGIPAALPALLLATKIQSKSGMVPPLDLVEAALQVVGAAESDAEAAIGQLLEAVVAVSRRNGVDAEMALHNAATAVALRFRAAEAEAAGDGVELAYADDAVRARYL
jgi:tetrapyrrole methylase family protein/MazG family protein